MPSSDPKPPIFSCPLTLEIMEEPIMDHCAHNFERSAILNWLANGHACCPISRKPLTVDDLVPNHTLAEQIEKWKWKKENGNADWASTLSTDNLSETDETTVEADGIARDDDDVELGTKRKRRQRRNKYHAIPPSASMFLPQELRAMEVTRAKDVQQRSHRRQQLCILVSKIMLVIVGTSLGGFVMWKLYEDNSHSSMSCLLGLEKLLAESIASRLSTHGTLPVRTIAQTISVSTLFLTLNLSME